MLTHTKKKSPISPAGMLRSVLELLHDPVTKSATFQLLSTNF